MKLDTIYEPIEEELRDVASGLVDRLERVIARQGISEALTDLPLDSVTHLFSSPGKLIRPALVLLSAQAVGADFAKLAPALVGLGIAVELVHSASLIHDDIIDGAESRREIDSVNGRFGSAVAVLAGDVLYAELFVTLLDLPGLPWRDREVLFRRVADATQRMCFGEMRERRILERAGDASVEEYLDVVDRKTAELMALSCAGAGIVSSAPRETVDRLSAFGRAFGMAFQLVDDALDGDAVSGPEWDPLERAEEFAREARERLVEIGSGSATCALGDLCGYVIDRAKVGVDRL